MPSASNGPLGYVRQFLILCATVALAVSLTARAAPPQLVRNINDAVVPEGSFPRELGTLNGKLLFAAEDAISRALWSTDGTAGGTVLLKRFPGPGGVYESSGRFSFVVIGPRAYFIADDGVVGGELWTTDGTPAGTTLVVDLRPGLLDALGSFKGVFGGRLVFSAMDSNGFAQMFITDGTAAGTQPLTAFGGGSAGIGEASFFADDRFYFVAHNDALERRIWVSDGTPGGTHGLTNPGVGAPEFENPRFFTRVGNRLLYADRSGLWRIDLTTNAIDAQTWDHPQGPPQQVGTIAAPISFGGYAMFITDGPAFGSLELWRTDGTSAGTFKVGGIHPGPAPFEARQGPVFTKVGDRAVYIADDGVNGPQLWSSDGSIANTVRLTDVSKPPNVSHQVAIPRGTIDGIGYFMMPDGASTTTWSLWRTDGTIAGTRKIAGLPAVDQSVAAGPRIIGDDTNVFILMFGSSTSTLWRYEPTPDRLTQLRASLRSFGTDLYFQIGQRLYFADNDVTTGAEPWVSDGTAAGTHLIRDIKPQGTADNGSMPNEFVQFGGQLVFVATHDATGRELWVSDGTEAGTKLLADINPGPESSNPNRLVFSSPTGALYFFATDATGKSQFMRMASPNAQPEALAVALPPPFAAAFCQRDTPAAVGNRMYFTAIADGGGPARLWRSDGTSAGTAPVTASAAEPTYPCELTDAGLRVMFGALGNAGRQIWLSDNSSEVTLQVSNLVGGTQGSNAAGLFHIGAFLYFTAEDENFRTQFWRSDGTAAGTQQIFAFNSAPFLRAVTRGVVNGKFLIELFDASAPVGFPAQRQLWVSDGTAAGTSLLKEFVNDGFPGLSIFGSHAYLAIRDSTGLEPWVTDGTLAGTQQLKDINTGDSNPAWFANFRGVTIFAASDANGPQLWRTEVKLGTPPRTTLLASVPEPPTPFTDPQPVLRQQLTVGQKLFFVARDPEIGDELYVLVNEAPVAGSDSAIAANGASINIPLLANDSDADGTLDPLKIVITTRPAHGTVPVIDNGSILYMPTAGFSGTDTFEYTVEDNQGATSNVATVTVTVTAATVVTTGRRGGGGSMGAAVLVALCVLLGVTRRASAIRSGASRTSAGRAMSRARRTPSTCSPRI